MKCEYKMKILTDLDCFMTYEMVGKEDHMELVISNGEDVLLTIPFASLNLVKKWTYMITEMAFGLEMEKLGAPMEDFIVDED